MRMKLTTFLDKLGDKINNNIEDVNYGGCCIVAYHVCTSLRAMGVKARVVVYDPGRPAMNTVRQELMKYGESNRSTKDWQRRGMGFWHVLVEFQYRGDRYLYDSDGCVSRAESRYRKGLRGTLALVEAQGLISSPHGWNSDFDRRQIPKLEKTIQKHFEKELTKAAAAA
jgi:hypothetical protein